MAEILDGRKVAERIKAGLEERLSGLQTSPKLAIVLATDNQSTLAYVRMIRKTAEGTGMEADIIDLGPNTDQNAFTDKIKALAEDSEVNGIIIQTPVADGLEIDEARSLIPPGKDVDGANQLSAGRLASGLPAFAPATAQAVMEILENYDIPLSGRHAVVIGRSRVIGKPVSQLLLSKDATVTVCHSRTVDISLFTRQADILVAAAGKTGLVTKEHINPVKNTVVIDVGTNFKDGKMTGDTDFEGVRDLAGAITPVPGGVGPVTNAILLRNTLEAYLKQK
ncbi:MAG TPA: bifunctional 5,10-methylenetetrahydrofolate dehydrogenase/5,10-methenyltetrahydrofolate cyclohydrolase [Candidatus Saccharimonadales bacterium]|nr:bifunctional 5,10-methylenetetrahydrofolate dehydrogenase/5,10-methenyltetrahydrofolate cyclohydrolase [Candidatus Saccharimonadales bacterium]